MFKLANEDALLATFRPKDGKVVELAPEIRFPLLVRHYVAWKQPAGGRVYLVFAVPDGMPTGIVFETNGSGPSVPHMCDWCHGTGTGAGVSLLTAYVNARKRVGVQVCSDLSCKQRIEDEADRAGTSALPGLEMLVARIGRFATEALRIEMKGGR